MLGWMGRRSDARDRLLDGAESLFRERGFASVSVAEICGTARVNKGSFYHFFPSKRALLLEILDRAWDDTGLLRQWETDMPSQAGAALRLFLEELFAYHYAERESHGNVRGCLLSNIAVELGSNDAEISPKIQELHARKAAIFENLLTTANAGGQGSSLDPHQAAESLMAYLLGLLALARMRNDLSTLPTAENDLLKLAGVNR